jgi:hypothetical protein
MRYIGHVAGRTVIHTGFWWETQEDTDYEDDVDVGGRIILN